MGSDSQRLTVGVIIPAYNAADHIGAALASLDRQTRAPDHVLVVDDGSVDKTGEIVEDWITKTRLRADLIRQPNEGVSAARNRALGALDTELCAPLDADDVLEPQHIEHLSSPFAKHPELVLAYGNQQVIDTGTGKSFSFLDGKPHEACPFVEVEDGFRLFTASIFTALLRANFIPTSASMFRVPVARAVGGYDTRLSTSEDREFLLRLCRRGAVGYLTGILARKHEGHESLTSDQASVSLARNSLVCLLLLRKKLENGEMSKDEQLEFGQAISGAAQRFSYATSRFGYPTWRQQRKEVLRLTNQPLPLSAKCFLRSIFYSKI